MPDGGPVTSPVPTSAPTAKRLLGGQAKYDIAEGIRRSVQWAAICDEMLYGDGDAARLRTSAGDERVEALPPPGRCRASGRRITTASVPDGW